MKEVILTPIYYNISYKSFISRPLQVEIINRIKTVFVDNVQASTSYWAWVSILERENNEKSKN